MSTSTEQFLLDVQNDRMLPYDATVYVGARSSARSWRIMDKVRDKQNKKTGTALLLPDEENALV